MFHLRDRRSVVRLPQASQVVSAELVVTQAARRRPRRRIIYFGHDLHEVLGMSCDDVSN